MLVAALAALTGCSADDHAGVPKTEARLRADAMAESYSASVRAHGSQLAFQRIEPARAPSGPLWVGTYLLLAPKTHEETLFCVYVSEDDAWAHVNFEGRCVRDDGKVSGSQDL